MEWRYVSPTSTVVHALTSPTARVAECGVGPVWYSPDWYGTGSQAEYERAASLPKCRRCRARIGHR